MKSFLYFCVFTSLMVLASCGGGGSSDVAASSYQVKTMLRLGHHGPVPDTPGFNSSIITSADSQSVADFVAQQASAKGLVVLSVGSAKSTDFSQLGQYLAAGTSHPNVRWVYLYDELFWNGSSVQIGLDEAPVLVASKQVHAAGLQTAVSILPDVILDPNFKVSDINAFDVIAIDVYPSIRPTLWFANCTGANPYTATLACSVKRLRDLGYSGQIWYIYQAFGDSADMNLKSELAQQNETIAAAPKLGITGLVSFGYYDDSHTNLAAPLYPGSGSDISSLVSCTGC